MNRAERRAAARSARRSGASTHVDCDCVPRVFEPVKIPDCPDCGRESVVGRGFQLPTLAPVGSLKQIGVGCACGAEYEVTCMVVA